MKRRSVIKSLQIAGYLTAGLYAGISYADWSQKHPYGGYNQGYGDFPPADIDKQLSATSDESATAQSQPQPVQNTEANVNQQPATASTAQPQQQAPPCNSRYTAVITRTRCRTGLNHTIIAAQVLAAHGITTDQVLAAHGTITDQASVDRGITVVQASAAHGMVVTADQVLAARGITMDRVSVHPGTMTGQVSAHGAMVADGAGNVFEAHPVNT